MLLGSRIAVDSLLHVVGYSLLIVSTLPFSLIKFDFNLIDLRHQALSLGIVGIGCRVGGDVIRYCLNQCESGVQAVDDLLEQITQLKGVGISGKCM